MTIDQPIIDDECEEDQQNAYREVSLKFFRILNIAMSFVTESRSPHVASWAINYAMGLAVCEGVSITDRAAQLRITPQALSKQIKLFAAVAGLPASNYMYKAKNTPHEKRHHKRHATCHRSCT